MSEGDSLWEKVVQFERALQSAEDYLAFTAFSKQLTKNGVRVSCIA